MRFPESWLREWINPDLDTDGLCKKLTLLGLEVDTVEPAAPPFDGVVVGRITAAEPHPQADRLRVCTVEDGGEETFQVVCGAPNARPGLVAPFARVGARLPDGTKIKKAKLRGVESRGMLCSTVELGLGEDADGLMELPDNAAIGMPFREWGELDDPIIELDLTPNRGDCLSIRGLARDLGAALNQPVTEPSLESTPAQSEDRFGVQLEAPTDCPRYAGRVIRDINPGAVTPEWLRRRLQRAGVRPLHPVVDITNYVMLELGQPMHAFDLACLEGGIRVRLASGTESITLLDGRALTPDDTTLVIADDNRAIALAGIMGGEATAVGDQTTAVFLESACFLPPAMAGRARRYGLHTDSAHRFERGVDPDLAPVALERATKLILEICGGVPGPSDDTVATAHLPERQAVTLRRSRLERITGMSLQDDAVESILSRLGLTWKQEKEGWVVVPPSWRFDLAIEADLIEEVARVHGYDQIPRTHPLTSMDMDALPERRRSPDGLRDILVHRGYHEAITYSFVDQRLQARLDPEYEPIALANPISSDMGVMRTSLWPGLVATLQHNQNRQQQRVRLFEVGLRFRSGAAAETTQENMIAGIIAGPRTPESPHGDSTPVDFFDLKGDVEALLASIGTERIRFEAASHPALHPGQSARVLADGEVIGWLGALSPGIGAELEIVGQPFLFEMQVDPLCDQQLPAYQSVSRYPSIRRDLALIVDEEVPAQAVLDTIEGLSIDELQQTFLFDVYQGKGVDSGRKSVALGLILQGFSRTLTDQDVDALQKRVLEQLRDSLGATLRE